MVFNSLEFALFFLIVYSLYICLKVRWQNILLLISSYFFYGWWDWRFLSLLWISTIIDYYVGGKLPQAEGARRKHLLLLSLITNLGILGFFKYFNFFVDSTVHLLNTIGLQPNAPVLNIILPVGISFYTFQTMAYTIDVYRKKMEPTRNFLTFAIYVAYFPQLVAGPIERAQHLIPQFEKPRRVTTEDFSSGALLVLIGLVRKVAIADFVAPYVDEAFNDPAAMSSMGLFLSVVLFSIQIYGDFAGYTDIARGVSRMIGIDLMENFNHPYFATTITEFWHRWHISLSTWLRDYLYIPLGGNRGSRMFVYRNLMLTMLLGGLWHGAAWTFVIWGGLHGVALITHKLWIEFGPHKNAENPSLSKRLPGMIFSWLVTMFLVGVTWVFFRASSFENAFDVLGGIFIPQDGEKVSTKIVAYAVAMLLFIDIPQTMKRNHTIMLRWPVAVRGLAYALMIFTLLATKTNEEIPFIYFQF